MTADTIRKRLTEMTLVQLESYLTTNNWVKDGQLRDVATIWHRQDSVNAEIVLPVSEKLKDYLQRLADAVEALASYEARPVIGVINDVTRCLAHLITVRVIHGDTESGTIPINDGVLLVQRAKDLLHSAAMSMYAKKKRFSGPPPKDVRPYLDSLLLGQTEVGSYVVNVIAPVPPESEMERPTPGQFEDIEKLPLASAVTASLTSSLNALSRAIDAYGERDDPTVFDEAVLSGASANMCDALLDLSGQERKRAFEIKISTAPTPLFGGETVVFCFDDEKVTHLAKASDYYKENYVLPGRTISGFIRRLDRPKGQETGTVTVASVIIGLEKSIVIELGDDDYDRAILAHRAKSAIECHGDVHVTSRTVRLMSPSGFHVIGSGDLFIQE